MVIYQSFHNLLEKDAKSEPKGAKGNQKERVPKVSQGATKMHQKSIFGKGIEKGAKNQLSTNRISPNIWSIPTVMVCRMPFFNPKSTILYEDTKTQKWLQYIGYIVTMASRYRQTVLVYLVLVKRLFVQSLCQCHADSMR